jgi:hypothetical protein
MSMQDSRRDDDDTDLLAGNVVVYAAMLGGTIAGQLAGIGLSMALGRTSIGIPFGIGVALEALAGARVAVKRSGRLTPREAGRLSLTYSVGLLAVSVPMVVWMDASHRAEGRATFWTPGTLAVAVVLVAIATVARWGLMVLLTRPRGRA